MASCSTHGSGMIPNKKRSAPKKAVKPDAADMEQVDTMALLTSERNATGYKGVHKTRHGTYRAQCETFPCKRNHLGNFSVLEDAAKVYTLHWWDFHKNVGAPTIQQQQKRTPASFEGSNSGDGSSNAQQNHHNQHYHQQACQENLLQPPPLHVDDVVDAVGTNSRPPSLTLPQPQPALQHVCQESSQDGVNMLLDALLMHQQERDDHAASVTTGGDGGEDGRDDLSVVPGIHHKRNVQQAVQQPPPPPEFKVTADHLSAMTSPKARPAMGTVAACVQAAPPTGLSISVGPNIDACEPQIPSLLSASSLPGATPAHNEGFIVADSSLKLP